MGKTDPVWQKNYMKKYYQRNKKSLTDRNSDWRKSHKAVFDDYRKKWLSKNPHFKHYCAAKFRCRFGKYKSKGIKMMITPKEVKEIWVRDNAHLLKQPSIDRINSKGDYTKENCRFIELSENLRMGALSRWKKNKALNINQT